MIYVARLRGINVGGNNKINMSDLKTAFEKASMQSVSTYINSGNVIFVDNIHKPAELEILLEAVIAETFGLNIKVLLRDLPSMQLTVTALPDTWQNNAEMRCYIMFLWPEYNNSNIVKQIEVRPNIDNVKYVNGALLWRVMLKDINKSGMSKLAGTKLYQKITIRNCNTTRKILAIMTDINE